MHQLFTNERVYLNGFVAIFQLLLYRFKMMTGPCGVQLLPSGKNRQSTAFAMHQKNQHQKS